MVEPKHKKVKNFVPELQSASKTGHDDDDDGESPGLPLPLYDVELTHGHLVKRCLCPLELSDVLRTLRICNDKFSSSTPDSLSLVRPAVLMYVSMLSLFFEVSLRQQSRGILCIRISEVVQAGAENQVAVIDLLFSFLSLEDKFISYSASRAMVSFLLMLRGRTCEVVLSKLMDSIICSDNLLEVGHCVEVLRKVIEWKDLDDHPLEGYDAEPPQPAECDKLTLHFSDSQGSNEVKHIITKSLDSKWSLLVTKLIALIDNYSVNNEHVIVSFLSLWEVLISVKANLSVIDTKEFYSGLERLLVPLTRQNKVIIWHKILDLYNEVLCYGSTLALQDSLAEEPCNLAHLLIRSVKDRHFLDCVPVGQPVAPIPNDIPCTSTISASGSSMRETENESCVSSSADISLDGCNQGQILLHKVVLVILKAVAVTVKETHCDSSSENSSRSGSSSSEDVDLAIIERSLREVMRKLDAFVKSHLPFHPEASLAEWMVRLFADQDDWLVESMVCGLDIYTGLGMQMKKPELHTNVDPHTTFMVFLETVCFDHNVLLDLLVSNETSFLLYLLRYLKFVRRSFAEFVNHCGRQLDPIMTAFIRLRLSIDRLVSKNLFPYNINPVLKLLTKCEELYEDSGV